MRNVRTRSGSVRKRKVHNTSDETDFSSQPLISYIYIYTYIYIYMYIFFFFFFFVSCVVRRIWFGDMNIDVGHDDVKCVDDCKDSNICKFSGSHSKYDRKNKIF